MYKDTLLCRFFQPNQSTSLKSFPFPEVPVLGLQADVVFVSFAGAQGFFIILQNETMPLDDTECSLSDWCVLDWLQFDMVLD